MEYRSLPSRDPVALYIGHYIADVYDVTTSRWLTCDDTSIAVTSEESVRSLRASTGYIFFYEAKYVCSLLFPAP